MWQALASTRCFDGFRHLFGCEYSQTSLLAARARSASWWTLRDRSLRRDPFLLFPREISPTLYDTIVGACRKAGFEPIIGQLALQIAIGSFAIPQSNQESEIGVPSLVWREVFPWIGAIFIGGNAWARMTALGEPLPLGRAGGASNPQPAIAAETADG
jgi:hypothetical protein